MLVINKGYGCKNFLNAFLMTVVCGIFGMFQPIYLNVDNYLAALVTNRIYAMDNYCMFFNPVLCWIVGFMQKLIPEADSFTLLSRCVILLGIWCLSYFIATEAHNEMEILCIDFILFLLVVNASLFFDYFTIWASFFTCAGMILLLSALKNGEWKWMFAGTFFVVCGIIWRVESAAMFFPFFLLDLSVEFVFHVREKEEKKKWTKRVFKVFGSVALCVIVLLGIDYAYKHSNIYKDGVRYNNAVSSVIDFPMKPYEEVKEFLPEISENDYESLRHHFYADTDRIDADYAEKIAGAGAVKKDRLEVWSLQEVNQSLLETILASKKTIFYMVTLFLILICVFLSDIEWYYKLELFFAYSGAYLIMFFFAYIGRAPLRVINSAIYGVFGMAFILYFKKPWEKSHIWMKWLKGAIGIFTFVVICVDTMSCDFIKPQSLFAVKYGVDEKKWDSTYKDDALYFWATGEYVLHPMADFIEQGKFMTEEFMKHNMSCGDWTYGQVYFQEYLSKLGIDNPVKALIERENTYYVAGNPEEVLNYLREHYDEDTRVYQTGEIDGISVWKFEPGHNSGR